MNNLSERYKERVLIAPLPWGLGHAARCIPIIQRQLDEGHEVIIAAEGGLRALLKPRFPEVSFVELPFMEITYPVDGNMPRHFFLNGPRLLRSIWREHRKLRALIKAHNITTVISDSRFGLWNRRVKSIFITHQVHILSPLFEGVINGLNQLVMRQYDEVWIPDHAKYPGLAGKLSHPSRLPRHAKYIGPLSRFQGKRLQEAVEKKWDAVAVISGPEPQRSIFEAEIARQFVESDERLLLLRGKPEEMRVQEIGNIQMHGHLDDAQLIDALEASRRVISRSGYSSIMDHDALGIKAEYHATPGQTEQEYLAELHKR